MQAWRVGDVTITKIVEFELTGGLWTQILPALTPDFLKRHDWLRPHFVDEAWQLKGSFHALVVQTPTRRIIVDTCVGNDRQGRIHPVFNGRQSAFLRDLEDAGFSRHAIDTVLCTHMHSDHVGWSTMLVDGRWQPTFPRARYLYAREEFKFWDKEAASSDLPADFRAQLEHVMADAVQPVFDAGLADLVETDHRICDEVSLVHTPGHSPGHVSVRIVSRGEEALITGDAIHHPAQLAMPDVGADQDPERAAKTRRKLLDGMADRPALLIGTHFITPTAGRVVRDGTAYRLDV